jgi:ribosomal protein L37AE/L43A
LRDDFSNKTKEILAKRVGYCCSNCGISTTGPGSNPDGVSSNGVAAHICAASPDGPRYDPLMTHDERKSVNNGIWLCQNCAHLIDTNTVLYTVEYLHKMKDDAEEKIKKQIAANLNQRIRTPRLSVAEKNKIILDARILSQGGMLLRKESKKYKIAINECEDNKIYNVCKRIFEVFSDLLHTEFQTHIQLHAINVDVIIFDLQKIMPSFYDASNDWTGAQIIATNHEFCNFFSSDNGKKFINECNKIINIIEAINC